MACIMTAEIPRTLTETAERILVCAERIAARWSMKPKESWCADPVPVPMVTMLTSDVVLCKSERGFFESIQLVLWKPDDAHLIVIDR